MRFHPGPFCDVVAYGVHFVARRAGCAQARAWVFLWPESAIYYLVLLPVSDAAVCTFAVSCSRRPLFEIGEEIVEVSFSCEVDASCVSVRSVCLSCPCGGGVAEEDLDGHRRYVYKTTARHESQPRNCRAGRARWSISAFIPTNSTSFGAARVEVRTSRGVGRRWRQQSHCQY